MSDELSAKGLVVIGLSIDEDVGALQSMVARRKIRIPQICDGKATQGEIAKLYNAYTPRDFVLDRDGRIAFKHTGAKGLPKLREHIERLLARSTTF